MVAVVDMATTEVILIAPEVVAITEVAMDTHLTVAVIQAAIPAITRVLLHHSSSLQPSLCTSNSSHLLSLASMGCLWIS